MFDEDTSAGTKNESPICNEDTSAGTKKESQQSQPVHVEVTTAKGDKTIIDAGTLHSDIFIFHPRAKKTETSEKNNDTSSRSKRKTQKVKQVKQPESKSGVLGVKPEKKIVLLKANNSTTWQLC